MTNEAFAAGLIHDAGKLILDPYVLERKDAFEDFMKDGIFYQMDERAANLLGLHEEDVSGIMVEVAESVNRMMDQNL